MATTLSAQSLIDARVAQAQDIIDRLDAIGTDITAMNAAQISGLDIWSGGMPDDLRQVQTQTAFIAGRVRAAFKLDVKPVPGEAEAQPSAGAEAQP